MEVKKPGNSCPQLAWGINMTISAIGTESTLSLVDLLQQAQEDTDSILDSSVTLSTSKSLLASKSSKAQSAYGSVGATSSLGQAAIGRALSEMNISGKSVTFKDIAAYREQLEQEFSLSLRADLLGKGVSLDTEFSLTMDANGKVDVNCDDALAKETIRTYLAKNPDACDQFGYIQALSNLERARQSPAGASTAWSEFCNSKKACQAQAVEAFFSDAIDSGMNYASLLASFNPVTGTDASQSTSFYSGLNFTV